MWPVLTLFQCKSRLQVVIILVLCSELPSVLGTVPAGGETGGSGEHQAEYQLPGSVLRPGPAPGTVQHQGMDQLGIEKIFVEHNIILWIYTSLMLGLRYGS